MHTSTHTQGLEPVSPLTQTQLECGAEKCQTTREREKERVIKRKQAERNNNTEADKKKAATQVKENRERLTEEVSVTERGRKKAFSSQFLLSRVCLFHF